MLTEHILNTCKIGQGANCCRHLFAGETGFECGKLNTSLKEMQDARAFMDIAIAQGDNCPGVTDKNVLNDMEYIKKKLHENK